jgi:hypothetical protein
MELLTPEKIDAQKKADKNEARNRTQALAVEESKLIKSVSELKEKEKLAKEDFEKSEAERENSLAVKKTILQTEVEILEARKFEALKPIEIVKKEVEDDKKENKEQAEIIKSKENELLLIKGKLDEREKSLNVRQGEIVKGENEIVIKGNAILSGLETIKIKNEELATKYGEYYKKEDNLFKRKNIVLEREVKVMALEKANGIAIQQFKEKDIEQANEAKKIADQYQTLARAITEAKKKYNIEI